MLMRASPRRQHSIISANALEDHQLIGAMGRAEAADGQGGPSSARGGYGVHTRAVGQAASTMARLVHSAADARNDAVDDLEQMAIVAKVC